MDKQELNLILSEGEGYKIEFKESITDIEREIVAFANSSGGKILIGISNDGKIKGIQITNELKSRIQDMANHCKPKAHILFESIDNVLIINVKEGIDKPYSCSSGFYIRIGPNAQKMARDEIIEFIKSEGKIHFDELIEPRFSYPRDIDKGKIRTFLRLAGISAKSSAEKALINLNVAEKQEGKIIVNNAGVLFFAKEPQRFIPWSVFTVALFKDMEGVDIIDRKEITGSLFEIVDSVMDFVKLYAKVAYRFTGNPQRENIYEYPFDAIREAVINSVAHKYYFEHGHNTILRFLPDRIRIENYWAKPRTFRIGSTVLRRNPIICELFARIHFGEKMGTGFRRMKDICKRENSPMPEIEYDECYFYIIFKQSHEYLKMTQLEDRKKGVEKVGEKVGENERKIIELIQKNEHITYSELSERVGIHEKNIFKNIEKLKEKGILKRIGPDKGGHWEITN